MDNLADQPNASEDCYTYLDYFEKSVTNRGFDRFLGTRQRLADDVDNKPVFGDYAWMTFTEVSQTTQNLARGIHKLGLAAETEGDGRKWNFIGIWAKNRQEYLHTHLANMYFSFTTIGIFDSMGAEAVDFITKQTELATLFTEQAYIPKIIAMKKDKLATTVVNLVSYDPVKPADVEACKAVGITLVEYTYVVSQGTGDKTPFRKCKKDDFPIFSYTSGTTGDSKGVKLSHTNLLSSAQSILPLVNLNREDSIISYLPYPHSFEQVLLGYFLIIGGRIGYYSGDPLRLTEDCQSLQPSFFPSVPRLYNRIYSVLNGAINAAGGCKTWLAKKAIDSKTFYLKRDATYTDACYDKLVFAKICARLGGKVKYMITGSAPIDPQVLEFFKVCFCCPVMEGYGLTEVSGGASVTYPDDPVAGHVGGPLPCVKWRLKDVPEMGYLSTDKPYPRGELCMKGNTVFAGYYKRPDITKEAFEDGWFKTGDVCQVYPNGSVKIIDRSKNIFKLS